MVFLDTFTSPASWLWDSFRSPYASLAVFQNQLLVHPIATR